MTYLGIDLGTSGLRALLLDEQGTAIGSAERHCEVSHPHPGWSEQDPSQWIAALEGAIAELRATHPQFLDLKGIGVAGHMHGATLLDRDDSVLRPCILWNDTRASEEAQALDQMCSIREISGNIVFPGFTAPKLTWLRTHEPDIFDKVAKVLLPAGYLNLYLTGQHVADLSDSAGTSWLDVGQRTWSQTLLDAGHMRRDQMPDLVEGAAAAGQLRSDLQRAWGIEHPVTVAGGAGDNAAAACGIGAMREGQGFVSLGTSGVLLAARDGYYPAPETAVHTFCHAVPDRWYQMGVMLSATDSLNWLARVMDKTPMQLTQELGETLRSPGVERFLPYLSGERTPHNDAEIRGSLTGLSTRSDRQTLTRAVLEGVCYGLRDSLMALHNTGARMDSLIAIGGGTASPYWVSLLATVLGLPLQIPAKGDFGAALGAARLAHTATTGADPEAIMTPPKIERTVLPDADLQGAFHDGFAAFKSAYPLIKQAQ